MADDAAPPQDPAGPFEPREPFDAAVKAETIAEIADQPARLIATLAGLTDDQLDTTYRNWTVRQIVGHLADAHMHMTLRVRYALAEDHPTVTGFEEGDWVRLPGWETEPVALPRDVFAETQTRLTHLLSQLTDEQFGRTFHHGKYRKDYVLKNYVQAIAWHGRHHVAQIEWLRRSRGW